MTWFTQGLASVEKAVEVQREARENQPPPRIWIPPNSDKRLIYLDDIGFNFYEHSFVMPGRRIPIHMTCIGRQNGCPACAANERNYMVTLRTVVDICEYTDNQGNKVKNPKRIHALKSESALLLAKKSERWGGLTGLTVIVGRKGNKDFAAGSDFEMVLKDGQPLRYNLNPQDEKHRPFDYEKIYAPKSVDAMREILAMAGIGMNFQQPQGQYQARSSAAAAPVEMVSMDSGFEAAPQQQEGESVESASESDVPF